MPLLQGMLTRWVGQLRDEMNVRTTDTIATGHAHCMGWPTQRSAAGKVTRSEQRQQQGVLRSMEKATAEARIERAAN
eukprot:665330-Pelagomonas_calceolata.AAC.2